MSLHFQNHWLVLLTIIILLLLLAFFIQNIMQKKHSILRSYPLIGNFRYLAEYLGVFFRAFFSAKDYEELPFHRAQRTWVYEAAKNADTIIGFGSTRPIKVGSIFFVDASYPLLEKDAVKTSAITLGKNCKFPYTTSALINISAMSFGAISENAILALGRGAKMAGCWMDTGEGGLTEYHLQSGCDIVAEIGTAKFGYRDLDGNLCLKRLKAAAAHPQVKMFEIKLSQGAKPGVGGLLPAAKVTPEIAAIRGIEPYKDCISPNRFPEISNSGELLDFIKIIRETTGKPTGFKIALGDYKWLEELFSLIIKRGIDSAPDFITLDGAEGGSGATPQVLADYVGLPLSEGLPALIDTLVEYGLRDRIRVIASGKLITPDKVAWAFCMGADLVNSARGFMLALGCIQALRCDKNTCPTGITTHNKWLMRALDPTNKANRVYHYVKNLESEVAMICHSCGVDEPRHLKRHHVRIVMERGVSISLEELYPNKEFGSKLDKTQ